MADEILAYYNRELRYIQELAAEFADRHPQEAEALRIKAGHVADPHVERLIQAFALLCARIRFKLDDDFPELTESLLGHLYPHYLAPLPSMAIVRFEPDPELEGYCAIARGTEIETAPVLGEPVPCRYRTCYPVVLRPLRIADARLSGLPLDAPPNPAAVRRDAAAVLRLTVDCVGPNTSFAALAKEWERAPSQVLRIYISAGRAIAFPLYELLFNHVVSVAVATSPRDREPVILPPQVLRPVGFAPEDGLLPYGPRSFIGYRLLTEYFAYAEKFLFFDVSGLTAEALMKGGKSLDLYLYLNRSDRELEKQVGQGSFSLGCTPMINLFSQRAEPIALTQSEYEYPVAPDRRRARAFEVFSVDRVVASKRGRSVHLKPFFAIDHGNGGGALGGSSSSEPYWQLMRRQALGGRDGTDAFLAFVDDDFKPDVAADWIVSVETTCLNRDLPSHLPFGGGEPVLQLAEGAAGIAGVNCLTPPTPTLRLAQGNGTRWRLLSHLILNHLSLLDPGAGDGGESAGAEALRETLRLYDIRESETTRKTIEAIKSVKHRRGIARVPFAVSDSFCHGIDVELEIDRGGLPGGGVYLLAAVLERFLGTACSINAFTRLTIRATNQEDIVKTWPPRAGDRILV